MKPENKPFASAKGCAFAPTRKTQPELKPDIEVDRVVKIQPKPELKSERKPHQQHFTIITEKGTVSTEAYDNLQQM